MEKASKFSRKENKDSLLINIIIRYQTFAAANKDPFRKPDPWRRDQAVHRPVHSGQKPVLLVPEAVPADGHLLAQRAHPCRASR